MFMNCIVVVLAIYVHAHYIIAYDDAIIYTCVMHVVC